MTSINHPNGLMSPPQTEKDSSVNSPPRIVLAGKIGRILCVADIRGDYHELNRLIREHEATAVIHTGDFGFINAESLDRMGDRILRHLLLYSPLIPPATRTQLLSIPSSAGRAALVNALNNSSIHFPLSQFPHLISGAITFPVPVFTVWGLIEDVRVLEKFRTGEYEVHNLSVLDEAASRLIEVGGLKLRLFGLGGAVAAHRMFDNGEGYATIAGGQGTMWTTALQIGELVDTAQRVYDETETRLLVSSAPISRNGILSQLSIALNADLTISGGLHFRYPASFNEFSVHGTFQSYRAKLIQAKDDFAEVYSSVKERMDVSMNEMQQSLLKKAIEITQKIPEAETDGKADGTWTNTWHWVLSDASCGHLLFSVTDGRVSAETKSTGLNFSHRISQAPAPPSAPVTPATFPTQIAHRPSVAEAAPMVKPAPPTAPRAAHPPTTGAPHKPTNAPPPGPLSNIRGIATRPPQPPARPSAPTNPVAATANGTPAQPSAQSSMPAKPPAQARPPRGAGSLAGQALAAAGVTKDRTSEGKTMTDSPASSKPTAPPAGKSETPSAAVKPPNTGSTSKPATPGPSGKAAAASATSKAAASGATGKAKPATAVANGKPSPASTPGPEKPKETKAGTAAEQKATGPADNKTAPSVNSASTNGEPTDSTPPTEDAADKGHSRDASTDAKPSSPTKKSLYVKGIPVPTTQDELKALFKSADKITSVKIISDLLSKKQKDYAYVDFQSEEDMQEALKSNTGTIRETPVNVSVSNPPSRFFGGDSFRGGRGRGSFRGRGGMRGGFAGGAKKEGGDAGGGEKKESAAAAVAAGGGGGGDQ